MQRIDGPTRAAVLPAPAATGAGASSPGYWADGTIADPDWLNSVQEEIIAVLVAAGIAPNKATRTQLRDAINTLIANAVDQAEAAPTYVPGNPGYRISADGFVEMWGYESAAINARGNRNIAFPIAFPGACDGISLVPVNSGSTTSGGTTTMQLVSLTGAGATVRAQNEDSGISDCAGGFRWRAWGH